ncbi:hypothetical protein [Paraburkholderia sp. J67]|uniref:hypothetical protein n=1 Tax=Paraburkholderia sp. J67 TaxID=2805435 RepID=UPI002ABE2114|nr:hypothetical protein [Paraburkholderia sp. J67]
MIRTLCAFFWLTSLFGTGLDAWAAPIRIESGTYGANCGAQAGNATRELALHCHAVDTCRYPVALPASLHTPGACRADFVAEWSCGPGEFHQAVVRAAARRGGTLVLSCVPSTGAGK